MKNVHLEERVRGQRRGIMKFYTIKLPRVLGGLVRAMLGAFKKG
jgi:stage V sporulation protein M